MSPKVGLTWLSQRKNLTQWLGFHQKTPPEKKETRGIGADNQDFFDHACEAHSHLATVAANMSSLAKITDREMLQIVMKSAVASTGANEHTRGVLEPHLKTKSCRCQRRDA